MSPAAATRTWTLTPGTSVPVHEAADKDSNSGHLPFPRGVVCNERRVPTIGDRRKTYGLRGHLAHTPLRYRPCPRTDVVDFYSDLARLLVAPADLVGGRYRKASCLNASFRVKRTCCQR